MICGAQLMCVRILVLRIYVSYCGAGGKEEETSWRQENFGGAPV